MSNRFTLHLNYVIMLSNLSSFFFKMHQVLCVTSIDLLKRTLYVSFQNNLCLILVSNLVIIDYYYQITLHVIFLATSCCSISDNVFIYVTFMIYLHLELSQKDL